MCNKLCTTVRKSSLNVCDLHKNLPLSAPSVAFSPNTNLHFSSESQFWFVFCGFFSIGKSAVALHSSQVSKRGLSRCVRTARRRAGCQTWRGRTSAPWRGNPPRPSPSSACHVPSVERKKHASLLLPKKTVPPSGFIGYTCFPDCRTISLFCWNQNQKAGGKNNFNLQFSTTVLIRPADQLMSNRFHIG